MAITQEPEASGLQYRIAVQVMAKDIPSVRVPLEGAALIHADAGSAGVQTSPVARMGRTAVICRHTDSNSVKVPCLIAPKANAPSWRDGRTASWNAALTKR